MQPSRDPRYKDGLNWRCRVKNRESAARYHAKNPKPPEHYRERSRKVRSENPDYDREWRERNKERVNAQNRAWAARNPDSIRENVERRRARRLNLPADDHTRDEIWERDGGICVYCHEPADERDWHLAHLIALSDHRLDNPGSVRSNVAVAHPRCNVSAGPNPYNATHLF